MSPDVVLGAPQEAALGWETLLVGREYSDLMSQVTLGTAVGSRVATSSGARWLLCRHLRPWHSPHKPHRQMLASLACVSNGWKVLLTGHWAMVRRGDVEHKCQGCSEHTEKASNGNVSE